MIKKLLVISCMALSLSCMGQKKTFKAACLNVDGLPPSITIVGQTITLNTDGPQEKGSERISELIAQKGWDFVGLSEDFNYHTQLMSKISNYYDAGTYRGEASKSNTTMNGGLLKIATDGLEMLWKKSISATDETYGQWTKTNGYTSDGADQLLLKGYRYYCITVANGLAVDVYDFHMDAETSSDDIAARESQINQLVTAIKASDNHRPIIILGDTNCRYTRDKVEELLINAINADERFEIHDPWVDFQWGGVYPTYGTDAMMTRDYGDQKGEVVDKIFYVNNTDANGVKLTANSYQRDMDFTYADGTAFSDHYPIVVDFTIENTNSSSIATGSSYYLRNVATGEFLTAGSNYGTHAVVGPTGNYVTIEKGDNDGEYYLHSTCGYISHDCWMDSSQDAFAISTAEDGKQVITYTSDSVTKALTALDTKRVEAQDHVQGSAAQEWELLSREELIAELYDATEESPKDATFFIKGANFSRNDSANDAWTLSSGNKLTITMGKGLDGDVPENNFIAQFKNDKFLSTVTNSSAGTMSQSASGLPNGKYYMTLQVFVDSEGNNMHISANSNEVTVPLITEGATAESLYTGTTKSSGKYVPGDAASAAAYFNAGYYTTKTAVFTVTDHNLDVLVSKDHTTSAKWYAIDNFKLYYLGQTEEDTSAYDKVKKAMDDAQAKAESLGLDDYDNSVVEERYYNKQLVGNGDEEVRMTYIALANASKNQTNLPADMRYVILNNSFEMGDLTYWTAESGSVVADAEERDADGTYTYNGNAVSQSTEDFGLKLPNGTYKLKALLSSGGTITANGVTSEKSEAVEGALEELTVKFEVTAGVANISASGMAVADNFRLIYYGEGTVEIDRTIQSNAYSTLILPFESEIPDNLAVYSANSYSGSDATKKVVVLTAVGKIVANTPYVVKYAEKANSAKRRTARMVTSGDFEFVGVPTNTQDTYTDGLLTGTLVDANVGTGNYVFDENVSFNKVIEETEVGANHAYISGDQVSESEIVELDVEQKTWTGVDVVMVVADEKVDVYGVNGVLVKRGVSFENALDGLSRGVYIVRSASSVIKVIK